jgi:hypothetical protein
MNGRLGCMLAQCPLSDLQADLGRGPFAPIAATLPLKQTPGKVLNLLVHF